MWPVKPNSTNSERGGFQNRDVGRSDFDHDYGPSYGSVDYARFSDPQNIERDDRLTEKLHLKIAADFVNSPLDIDLKVKNGFAIINGYLPDEETKRRLIECLHSIEGMVDIIWDLRSGPSSKA